MGAERVLVLNVSPPTSNSGSLRNILESDFTVVVAAHLQPSTYVDDDLDIELGRIITQHEPRLVFIIASHEQFRECKKLLSSLKRVGEDVPSIVSIESCEPDQAFTLLKYGAADFITSPFQTTNVLPRAWRLLNQLQTNQRLTRVPDYHVAQLIGESAIFLEATKKIPLIASCEANVLIVGETGTGKELYARAIHYASARAGKPFMPVNCGAIPVELVENELFGHDRGAFTSASNLQVGLIEEANGGTLFLDEIDCLPIFAQVKLLRFLQEKEYRRLGSPKIRHANVRVIAASNVNLSEAVDNGKVRQDLFYRLNILSVTLPPLRDRREDIPLLARSFLTRYARESQKQVTDFSEEVLNLLMVHSWPGNVRELDHVVERAVVLSTGEIIQPSDIHPSSSIAKAHCESLQEAKAKEIARFEKSYIQGVLSICSGNITKAAQVAKKNRRAFWQLIQKHQIDVSRFKPVASQ